MNAQRIDRPQPDDIVQPLLIVNNCRYLAGLFASRAKSKLLGHANRRHQPVCRCAQRRVDACRGTADLTGGARLHTRIPRCEGSKYRWRMQRQHSQCRFSGAWGGGSGLRCSVMSECGEVGWRLGRRRVPEAWRAMRPGTTPFPAFPATDTFISACAITNTSLFRTSTALHVLNTSHSCCLCRVPLF